MGKTPQHVADSKRVAEEERRAFDRRARTLQIQRARACQPKRASGRTATRKGRSKTPSPLPTPALTHVPQPPAASVLPTIFSAASAELPKKEDSKKQLDVLAAMLAGVSMPPPEPHEPTALAAGTSADDLVRFHSCARPEDGEYTWVFLRSLCTVG